MSRVLYSIFLVMLAGSWGAEPGRPVVEEAPPTPESSAIVSPIAYFRQLLASSPQEVQVAIASRPAAQRGQIELKLEEYRAMPSRDRDRRLRATEIRWYFRYLIALEPHRRPEALRKVPETFRLAVQRQVQLWEALPASLQQDIQKHESILYYILRTEGVSLEQRAALQAEMSPAARARLEQSLSAWKSVSPERRQQMFDHFRRFVELPVARQQRSMDSLPLTDEERREVQATLDAFAKLPPSQRQLCLHSFGRFTRLSSEERVRFLRNADRWRELSPQERELWRKVVVELPPSPPGLGDPPMPPPLGTPDQPPVPR